MRDQPKCSFDVSPQQGGILDGHPVAQMARTAQESARSVLRGACCGKQVPFSDSTWMVPPWASMRLLVIFSPSPVPPNFLVALMSPCAVLAT